MPNRVWLLCIVTALCGLWHAVARGNTFGDASESQLHPNVSSTVTDPSLKRLSGTVTLTDPSRNLIVLQEGDNATALSLDTWDSSLKTGERIELEGRLRPLIPALPGYPTTPTSAEFREAFEAPTNRGNYFLSRIRGQLHPPATGDYTFWIASDDSSQLVLSDSEDPSRARRIAQVATGRWTEFRQWTRITSQQSSVVHLEAGHAYYIEALCQQGTGRYCLSVAWQGPGFKREVIDGRFITPMESGGTSRTNSPGILWEYWEDFFSGDLSVLKIVDEHILRCDRARILKREPGALPAPLAVRSEELFDPRMSFHLVDLDGSVQFISQTDDGILMELRRANSRFTARFQSADGFRAVIPNQAHVRLRGVFEPWHSLLKETFSGTVWVRSWKDVDWIDDNDNWSLVDLTPQHELNAPGESFSSGRIIRAQGRVLTSESPGMWNLKGADTFQAFVSSDGTNWVSLAQPVEINLDDRVLVGFAIASHRTNELATVEFDHISGFHGTWAGADIGETGLAGNFDATGSTLQVRGSGNDVWYQSDDCHFAYQPMQGDFEIIAHLAELKSPDLLAKTVLMVRESISSNSPWAGIALMPGDKIGLQSRDEQSKAAAGSLAVQPVKWIKLQRQQNSFLVRSETASLQNRQLVDVLGTLEWMGTRPVLARARVRAVPGPNDLLPGSLSAGQMSPDIHDVQISELKAEAEFALRTAHPMRLHIRGVVSFNDQVGLEWFTFVQDNSGGMRLQWKGGIPGNTLRVGDWVDISGNPTLSGPFPELMATAVTPIGTGEMPEPEEFPLDHSKPYGGNGKWTEVRGTVRSVTSDGVLSVIARSGLVQVRIGASQVAQVTNLVNAFIRARGVAWTGPNPTLLLQSVQFLEVVEAPPRDPFDIPTFPVGSLPTLENNAQIDRRLKIFGVITSRRKDFVMVQDGALGIRVETASATNLNIGDAIDAVGFLARRPFGTVLSESLLRVTGHRPWDPLESTCRHASLSIL